MSPCYYQSFTQTTSELYNFMHEEACKLSVNLASVKDEAMTLSAIWKGKIVCFTIDMTDKAKNTITDVSLKTLSLAAQAKDEAIQRGKTWTKLLIDSFGDDIRRVYDTAVHTTKAVTTVLLFLSNSSLFVVGGITAFVVPEKMKEINQRLVEAWSGREVPVQNLSQTPSPQSENPDAQILAGATTKSGGLNTRGKAAVVFATIFAWPIVFASASFFVGAQVALDLQNDPNN